MPAAVQRIRADQLRVVCFIEQAERVQALAILQLLLSAQLLHQRRGEACSSDSSAAAAKRRVVVTCWVSLMSELLPSTPPSESNKPAAWTHFAIVEHAHARIGTQVASWSGVR